MGICTILKAARDSEVPQLCQLPDAALRAFFAEMRSGPRAQLAYSPACPDAPSEWLEADLLEQGAHNLTPLPSLPILLGENHVYLEAGAKRGPKFYQALLSGTSVTTWFGSVREYSAADPGDTKSYADKDEAAKQYHAIVRAKLHKGYRKAKIRPPRPPRLPSQAAAAAADAAASAGGEEEPAPTNLSRTEVSRFNKKEAAKLVQQLGLTAAGTARELKECLNDFFAEKRAQQEGAPAAAGTPAAAAPAAGGGAGGRAGLCDLPDEVLVMCCLYLRPPHLGRAAASCQRLRAVLGQDSFWRDLLRVAWAGTINPKRLEGLCAHKKGAHHAFKVQWIGAERLRHCWSCDMDKAEGAVAYLIAKCLRKPVGDGFDMLAAILPGSPIGRDIGYGPGRVARSADVKALATALEGLTVAEFRAAWTPTAHSWPAVLGGIARFDDDTLEYCVHHFLQLRLFISACAARPGCALLIQLF